jgi:hypothetical protein
MKNPSSTLSRKFTQPLPLPEYRQIELYSKKKKLRFAPDIPGNAEQDFLSALLADTQWAFFLLDNAFSTRDPLLFEGQTSWARYLALPRKTTLDRIIAELYRILRICHIAARHPKARREMREGLIRISCEFNQCALALNLTPAGIGLLCGAVCLWLDADGQPYSDAYHEALLTQYFADLVEEIRKFSDEDRVLYQFRPKIPWFNRHFRLDCDNPRCARENGFWRIDIGAKYQHPARYPIDFYLPLDDALYIIPAEALNDGALPETELPRWRAKLMDGALPAGFSLRFSREEMVVGQPMT